VQSLVNAAVRKLNEVKNSGDLSRGISKELNGESRQLGVMVGDAMDRASFVSAKLLLGARHPYIIREVFKMALIGNIDATGVTVRPMVRTPRGGGAPDV